MPSRTAIRFSKPHRYDSSPPSSSSPSGKTCAKSIIRTVILVLSSNGYSSRCSGERVLCNTPRSSHLFCAGGVSPSSRSRWPSAAAAAAASSSPREKLLTRWGGVQHVNRSHPIHLISSHLISSHPIPSHIISSHPIVSTCPAAEAD